MITEKALKRWRREALVMSKVEKDPGSGYLIQDPKSHTAVFKRILLMTQELLDQHLLRK